MRTSLFLAGACALLLSISAAPAPEPAPAPAPAPGPDPAAAAAAINDNTPEIIEIIAPAASAQETLSTLNLGAPGAELSERNKRTIGILRQLFPTLTQEVPEQQQNLLSGAESQQAEVRVAFGEQQQQQAALEHRSDEDQQTAAQTNTASIDEITLDDADNSEENRNKRFLSFGGSSGGQSSAGGGSGNFLFDIVRLVAGSSGGSSGGGEAIGGGSDTEGDDSAAKGDNLTEGVPGPITRLFIIANRGIANLIQDLILRLAQTSERIVNFKARLITSII
ncbi:ensconsin isoform X2 [Leguminivora glycinivorella]|uniref:ensconsin isoform X2 n=1 Tax=Leguminivora glycinivorella TaxID=1035111 RepID=UPI00200C8449|nr:ensconsin isoform X2 [Leguminivora glycinivorella]